MSVNKLLQKLPIALRVPKTSIYQDIVLRVLRPMNRGRLSLKLAGGESLSFGTSPEVLDAELTIHDPDFFKRIILGGELALGDLYCEGAWSSPSPTKVLEWFIINRDNGVEVSGTKHKRWAPLNLLKSTALLGHRMRANTLSRAQKNIAAHYDLSNTFYQLFLDESMTYSSGLFINPEDSLEQAQINKIDRLLNNLKLQNGDRVLEIGSGWGALAIRAATQYDIHITTITLSKEQHSYVTQKIIQLGLAHKIKVELKDYRLMEGVFDKIVSVEMIEAVGHKFLTSFYKQCHKLLKYDGLLALQAIVFPHSRYEEYRRGVDWIQKEIFPGGHLPTINGICQGLSRAGEFELRDLYDLGYDYAQTLRQWRNRLQKNGEGLFKLGLDEAFVRKWNYYLCYCEAGFNQRHISTAQLVFSRVNGA